MAEMTDSLGRFIQGQNTSNMTLGQIKELLSSGLKVGVGEAKAFGKKPSESTSSGSVSKLTSLFEQYTKSFSNDIKEQKDYIKQMIGVLTEIKNSKEENKNNPKEKEDKKSKGNEKAFKSMDDLAKKGLHKGSIYTHDVHCEHILRDIGKDLKNIAKKMKVKTNPIPTSFKLPDDYPLTTPTPTPTPTPTGGGGGGKPPIPANPFDSVFDNFDDGFVNISKDLKGQEKNLKSAQKSLQKAQETHHGEMIRQAIKTANTVDNFISKSLLGLTGGVFETMFQGFIKNDVKIIQDTRAIAYEIEGATKNSKSLNKSFEDFGTTVKATGMDRDKFAKEYIDNMKIGIKNAKIAQKITVAQLNTERQLGMEAGVLKDTFQTMATDLHMNTAEVADMGRGMRDVARFTGLTGEKLKGVIDSSAEFSKNMQKAGNLTAQSYKNIIELGANFKKFGADGSQILTMLSSTNKLLEGNSETFTLLAQSASRVGLTSELLSGSLLKNKKSLQGLYQGMKSIAGQFGIAGNNAEEMRASLENMDDFTKARMNISLKAAYGMEAGELLNTLEAVGASSETLSDKLDNLNKKKQKNLTLEERAGIVEEERKLKLSKSMEVLASIDKAASSSKDMGEALGKFSKQRGTFEGDLKALGVAWTSETDVARGAITNALDGVNKQLKDAGKAELKISSDEIEKAIKDPTAIRELTAKITKAEQEASTASKAQLDPASSAAQSLIEINDTIRNLSQNGLSSIFNSWIGKLLIPLAAIAAGVAFAGSKALTFYEWSKGWASSKKSITDAQTEVKKNEDLVKIHNDLLKQGHDVKDIANMARQARKPGSIYTHDIHLEKILLAIHETIKNCCMGDKGKTPVPQAAGKPDPMAALTQAKPTAADPMNLQPKTPTPTVAAATTAAAGKPDPMAALTQAKPTADPMSLQPKTPTPTVAASTTAAAGKPDPMAALTQAKPATAPTTPTPPIAKKPPMIGGKTEGEWLELMKQEQSGKTVATAGTSSVLTAMMQANSEQAKADAMSLQPKTPTPTVAAATTAAAGKPDPMAALTQAKPTADPMNLQPKTPTPTVAAATTAAAGKPDPMAALTQAKPTAAPTTPTPSTAPPRTEQQQANDALKQRLKEQKAIKEGTVAPKIAPPKPAGISDTEKIAAAQKRGISESGLEKMKAGLGAKSKAEGEGKDFRLQRKIEEHQKKKMKAEKIQMKHDGKMMRVEKEEVKVGMPSADSSFLEDAISQIKNIKTEDLIKAGGILMALAAALVILGIGIVFLGSKLLKLTGLDLATVAETAAVVVAVGAAAGGIAYAALELLGKIEELKSSGFMEKFKGGNAKELLMVAGAVAILGPILIILGAAVIKLAQLITSKLDLDLSKILEVSAIVVALGVAAGGIAVASVELIEQLEDIDWKSIDIKNVLLGAAALLVIGPAMVLLGAAIIKMSDLIIGTFNLDLKTAIRVGTTVAAILVSAALIAGAIVGAIAGLFVLGKLTMGIKVWGPFALLGALAFLILTPIILTLAAAILKMSKSLMGAFNLTPREAFNTGMQVAGVLASAAIIAVSILGAVAGLVGLGTLAWAAKSYVPMMLLGAAALLVLTPAILTLGSVIIKMSDWLLGEFNLNASTAWEIGMTVAGVISAAAIIAVSILGAVAGLVGLGTLAKSYKTWGKQALIGAVALLVLTPIILTLGSAVLKMSEWILGSFGLDSSKAFEIGSTVAAIITSAGLISVAIIAAIAGLVGLGILAMNFYAWAAEMAIGAVALLILTPAILALAAGIIAISDGVLSAMGVDPNAAKETASAVGSIISSASDIALGVLAATAGLVALGSLVMLAPQLALAMLIGAAALLHLTPAILLLSVAILKMAKSLSFEKGQAEKIVENLDATLDATTSIAFSIIKMAIKLAIISTMAMYATLLIPLLYLGSWALWALTIPIRSYVSAVTNFYDSLIKIVSPKKAAEMGKGVADIMGAVGIVTEEIMKAKDKLSNLSQYAGFFDFLIGNSLAKTMYAGGKVLRALMSPTAYYVISVVNFSRFLASIIEPKKATQMGKDVAELLAGIAAVTDEIMKVKDKLANFPEYGSFWNWLMNNNLPDQMWKGVTTLLQIMNPTKMYVMAIVLFSRNIASIIDPRKATEMGRGVAEILAGVASVNEEIMKVKDKLINVPKHSGFWTWLRGIPLQETLREGVLALHEMMGPVTTYIQTIVAFSKRVGSVINPKLAKSMGQGVADIIDGCMVVTDAIYKAKDKLVNVPKYGKFWAWVSGGSLSEIMDQGVLALKDIMEPTKKYIESIVTFSKTVGSVINPNQAKEMGQGVADVIDACMVVTDSIYKVKDKLKKVPRHSKFWEFFGGGTLQDSMNEGVYALNSMMTPVKNYAASIVNFSKSVGEVIDPKQAKEMGQGIADILASIGQVSDEIIKAKDKILSVGGLTSAVKDFVKLYGAAIAFRIIGSGILSFTNTMIGVVKQIESKVDVETGKRLISVMKNVGELVSLTAQTVKDLNEKILPLTEAGWFSGSIVSQLNSAMPQFQSFFSTVPKFITDAIVKPMNTAFKDVQGLQDAGMKIKAIGILLSQVHPVIQQMQSNIVPYTESGFFKAAPIDQIKSGMNAMKNFFTEVASFITNGIVIPVTKNMASDDDLIDANLQLTRMSVVLASAGKVMQEMLTVIAYMDPQSFFSKSPVEKIMKNKDEFQRSFTAIAEFVKDGIVKPALSVGDSKQMKTAAERLCQTASIMRSTAIVLKSVDETFGLMESKSIFSDAPITKIMKNKDEFQRTFLAISQFIRDGIVNPVLATFPDPKIMITAGVIMQSMAKTISAVPPIIKNLAEAIGLMTESKSFFAKTPVETIMKNKDAFAKYFRTVAAFVRDAIVVEINTAFADVPISKIVAATNILTNLSRIISIIPNIIKGVSDGLIPLVVSKDAIKKAPLKAISESKDEFADYFRETAAFLRDGVVTPILEEFPDSKTLAKATGIISMMAQLLPNIPRVINQTAEGLIPLVVSKDAMKKAPMKMIKSSKDVFSEYFVAVAEFLRDGIVKPILEVLPDSKTLAKATGIISMMAQLLGVIPRIINSLSNLLGLLDPKDCMKDSPIEMLAKNAIIFGIYFYEIATFLKEGIVEPILYGMVDSKDLQKANQAINNMNAVIREIPVFIQRLSDGLSTLMFSGYFNFAIFSAAKIVGAWFSGIAYALIDGIILPLRLLPDDTELKEIITKLQSVTQIFGNIRQTIDSFAINLQPLTEGGFFTKSPIESLYSSAKIFAEYWSAITSFIANGIIKPISQLSPSKEIEESSSKLKKSTEIFSEIRNTIEFLTIALEPLTSGGIFSSSPIASLASSAQTFSNYWSAIATFIQTGIITPVNQMSGVEELKATSKKLGVISSIINGVKGVIDSFSQQIQPLTGGWLQNIFNMSPMAYMLESAKSFALYWVGIATFIQVGIITPVSKMSSVEELKATSQKLNVISNIINGVRGVIDSFSQQIQPLTGNWLQNIFNMSPMAYMLESAKRFASYWTGIAHFIQTGIIEPVNKMSGVDKLNEVMSKLNFVSGVLKAVRGVIDTFSEQIQPLTGNWLQTLLGISPIATMYESAKSFASYWTGIAHFIQVGIIEPVFKISGVDKLKEVIDKLNFVSGVLKAVRGVIDTFSEQIQPLTGNWLTRLLSISPIANMLESAKSFASYWTGIAHFIQVGIIEPVFKISGVDKLKEVIDKLNFVSGVLKAVRGVIDTFSEQIQPLTGNWLTRILSISPIATMYESAKSFASYWTGIAHFIQVGIIEPVFKISGVDKLKEVIDKLNFVSGVLKAVRGVIDTFSEQIQPLTGNWLTRLFAVSPIATMYESAKSFASYWTGIANFIQVGIIEPVNKMSNVEKLTEVINKLNFVSGVLKAVRGVIDTFSEQIQPLTGSWLSNIFVKSPIATMYESAKSFASYWTGIANFIQIGIIEPVNRMSNVEKLTEVMTKLTFVSGILIGVRKVIDTFSEQIQPLTGSWLSNIFVKSPIATMYESAKTFASYWIGIANFINNGIIRPISTLPDASSLNEITKSLVVLPDILKEVYNVSASLSENIAPLTNGGWFTKSPIEKIYKSIKTFSSYWVGISSFLTNGIINPIMNNLPDSTELTEALTRIKLVADMLIEIQKAMFGMSNIMLNMSSMNLPGMNIDDISGLETQFGAMAKLTNAAGSQISGLSSSGNAMEANNPVATAIPPEPSMREKVQKEVATSEPSSSTVSSPELTEIASEAVTQTELNEQMVELLTQIKDALGETDNSTKSNAGGMGGDTEARKVRNKPFMNTKWAYGSFLQTSGKGVTNVGSGTK